MRKPKPPLPAPVKKPVPPPATFVEAVRDTHRDRIGDILDSLAVEPPVTAEAWLGAVILDGAGVEPVELLAGSWHIRTNDEQITGPVLAGIRAWLWDRATRDDDWPEAGQVAVGGPWCKSGRWYKQALAVGCPTLVVTTNGQSNPPEATALADRYVELRQPDYPETLRAVIEAATGEACSPIPPRDCEGLGWADMQLVLHPGSTSAEALERVVRLAKARRGGHEGASEAVADLMDLGRIKLGPDKAKPDAVPLSTVADDVVRRLADMSGFGDARAWGLALAEDLSAYAAGTLPWRDVDRGVLLSGPPGCGKTTFAKALAMECEVELVTTTYTEWSSAGGSLGDTMSKGLTKLFERWRAKAKESPFVLFVDEIDTIGRRGGNDHNESWFVNVINAWLAFLDGAVPRDGIVVVAATNHPERVDPALLRPGRLDRHVVLPAPSPEVMRGILQAHLGHGADLTDLDEAARACRGLTPADVALVVRDARRLARRAYKRPVAAGDVADVVRASRLGEGFDPEVDRRIAVHEAGHAVATLILAGSDLDYVDLDGAVTGSMTRRILTAAEADAQCAMLLSGMAAEDAILGAHSGGCAADLRQATDLASTVEAAWGMGVTGPVALPANVAIVDPLVRRAVDRRLREAQARAVALVAEHRDAVERLADALVARRYLDAGEVREVVGSPAPACA